MLPVTVTVIGLVPHRHAVIDGCGIGQRQDLAVGKEVERTVGGAVTPVRRTVTGIAGDCTTVSGSSTAIAASCLAVSCDGDVDAVGVQVAERGEGGARHRPVGQVGVGKADGAGGRLARWTPSG